ncbi:MAG: aminotransferase class V-fold PLP-dependent enzyme [Bacteroidetes bacterium]|nr:aminotransferase class V-fold PLP-dependent enzyme [Bacteroidota bacterium]
MGGGRTRVSCDGCWEDRRIEEWGIGSILPSYFHTPSRTHPSVLDLRNHFFTPDPPVIELRAFTHGLMPRTVPAMMERFVADWRERGVDAWNSVPNHWMPDSGEPVGWWNLPEYLGDRFIAPMLGAQAGTCIMQPNAHGAVQGLLSAPEPFTHGRNEVVFNEAEFPSVQHSVRQWAALRGFHPRSVPLGQDGFLDVGAICDTITERTAWVFVSHVGFTTGEKLTDDALQSIADTAHDHDALFAVDGYHATGSSMIDVEAIRADAYFGGLLKEACGSSGNAYLYIREGLILTPAVAGWFGDADPFGFHPDPQPHPIVRRRFLTGTTAVASLYHAVEGLRVIKTVGIDAVRDDSLTKTELAIQHAQEIGLTLRSPREAERRSAMIILEIENAEALCEWLKTRHIFTDSRRDRYLRMAPFVWNTADDIERTFETIEESLRNGLHLKSEQHKSAGPVT